MSLYRQLAGTAVLRGCVWVPAMQNMNVPNTPQAQNGGRDSAGLSVKLPERSEHVQPQQSGPEI
eukprot:5179573-Amphidinium_carterae.1